MAILPFAAFFALVVAVEIQGQGSSPETVPCGNDDTAQKGEQGFPGKRGPTGEQGLQGPVGPKGDVGQCDPTCRTEYNELIERVQKLERIVSKTPAANCKEGLSWGRNISGIHSIVNPRNGQSMEVYCDQTTDNGGWLVFQRRTDGSENFYRTWAEYQEKFGNLSNEFWLGLENLHALTSSGSYELRVELEDCENDRRYAKYSSFAIGSGEQQYRLTVSGYSGTAGDSLSIAHNGLRFTTFDLDHDLRSNGNCAVRAHGAWWYRSCYAANLNGEYLNCQTDSYNASSWFHFRGHQYSLKFIEMKFRPI